MRMHLSKFVPGGVGLAAAVFTAAVGLAGCPDQGLVCSEGLTACGNKSCEDLQNDKRNCGGCGVACQAGEICQAGTCVCAPGATACNGECVTTASDPRHCGACGHVCNANEFCQNSECVPQCEGNTVACGHSCVELETDENNCGACGNVCDQGKTCKSGLCTYDVILACFTNGQVRGLQSGTHVMAPLKPLGSNPQALDVYGKEVLLSIDGHDNALYQASLSSLDQFTMRKNALGAIPNDILVSGEYVFVIHSGSNTLAVFKGGELAQTDGGSESDGGWEMGDAGEPDGGELDAGTGSDAGLWAGHGDPLNGPAPQFPMGVDFALKKEISFGDNAFPQVMVKVGDRLFVTLYGGQTEATIGAGQKVVELDISNPENPTVVKTYDLTTLGLETFKAGDVSVPRPQGITARGGSVYVALNNLTPYYSVAGPAYLAKISPDGTLSRIKLPENTCLNAVWVEAVGDKLIVSCAGKSDYSQFPRVITTQTGLVMVGADDSVLSSIELTCPAGDDTCRAPSMGRFGVSGNSIYVGDQAAGRVFVVEINGSQLVEKQTYAQGQPLNVCPVNEMTGYSNVADVLVVP